MSMSGCKKSQGSGISIEEAATEFNIDLSQYEKAFSMMDPAIIENQADNLGWSLQEQLKRMRGYQFEQFHHRQMTAFIKKDHTEGVMIHMDRSGTYVHYFESLQLPKGIKGRR